MASASAPAGRFGKIQDRGLDFTTVDAECTMDKEELKAVLEMIEEVRGGDLSEKPLWQQRGEGGSCDNILVVGE